MSNKNFDDKEQKFDVEDVLVMVACVLAALGAFVIYVWGLVDAAP